MLLTCATGQSPADGRRPPCESTPLDSRNPHPCGQGESVEREGRGTRAAGGSSVSQLHRTLFSVLDHSSAHVVAAAHCVLSLRTNRARQRRDGGGSQQSGQTISASTSATLIGWSWQRTGARVCGESRPWRASQVTTSLERTSVQPLPGQASHDLRTCLAYFLNFGKNGEVGSERELREARGAPGARAYVSLRSGLATAQPTNQPPNDPKPVRTHSPWHTAPPAREPTKKPTTKPELLQRGSNS